jgi:hypothetical protein
MSVISALAVCVAQLLPMGSVYLLFAWNDDTIDNNKTPNAPSSIPSHVCLSQTPVIHKIKPATARTAAVPNPINGITVAALVVSLFPDTESLLKLGVLVRG